MIVRVVAVLIAAVTLPAAVTPVSLVRGDVRYEAAVHQGRLQEKLWVKKKTGWAPIAFANGKTQGALSIRGSGNAVLTGAVTAISLDHGVIVEELRGDHWTAERTIGALGVGNWIRVSTSFTPEQNLTLHSLVDSFEANGKPDWSFSPSVGGFSPDAKYKSPLIFVQRGSLGFGIVPDVLSLDRASLQRCNHSLDLGVEAGRALLSVGFIPAKQAYHVVFKEDLDRTWTASQPVVNNYYIYIAANAKPGEAYREAVHFEWNQFGRPALANAADEQAGTDAKYLSSHLWEEWEQTVWEKESRESWLTVPLADGIMGGAVMMRRALAPKPSVYLGAWFNSLRTAYGMALYARRTHSEDLMTLARQTLNLALKAPGSDGAFKCFAVPNPGKNGKPEQVIWGAGDGAGVSVSEGFLGFDMSWTGYWMLKWVEAKLPDSESVIPRCERLADFLIARQRPDGSLPTRFDEAGQVLEDLSKTVSAETASVVRFLFELSKVEKNPKYRQAAFSGLAFIDRDIVPERKWYDFETFWSCSPRLVAFDNRTRQWPANNLALIHAVAAYLQAYQNTGKQSYLAKGRSLLDYLLLYQQTWTNPVLENLTGPSMLLGGFTTQNSDAEWSDARQSLAGEVIMDYYRATHDAEYLERGVEALRSQFPVSPSENWAHAGYGHKAGISSFHWGTGSGMAGIEMEAEYLRDAVCDLPAKRCVGVNGINVTKWEMANGKIDLQMDSPYSWNHPPQIILHGANARREYTISVNGSQPQTFLGAQLENGVPVALPSQTKSSTN